MKRDSSPSQADYQASERFNHRLNMYSVAAGAAGVGILALAQPAQGEIVYTAAGVVISAHGLHGFSYPLDLNHDGTADFFLNATFKESIDTSGGSSRIIAKPVQGNGVVGYGGSAAALIGGQPIGNARKFSGLRMASLFTFIGTDTYFRGKWANVTNRYLGLKFQIDGQTHYGWARLTLLGKTPLTATLTGYAYETIPNMGIIAGKTSGTDEAALAPAGVPSLQSDAPAATLGALALGAPVLPIWRRRELTMGHSLD
jgi:hypothetical protein